MQSTVGLIPFWRVMQIIGKVKDVFQTAVGQNGQAKNTPNAVFFDKSTFQDRRHYDCLMLDSR